ncbi:oligosaccharide repeat unit polymerase [Ornithinimicrobium faecis]|uniref:Oligosaccharide repeat unit polymerase n=1 Tax=Ornithinimicrobium faecis TaxID=2934158 RepID=A0ABY4YSP1_9MICO|nr:O-antigen polymerase [Ornithinimicrobium sp. HY1793]USQ79780.1 oligosaccharide repeat unit polymerase [Ornithinimicrobium sp. HY1793]
MTASTRRLGVPTLPAAATHLSPSSYFFVTLASLILVIGFSRASSTLQVTVAASVLVYLTATTIRPEHRLATDHWLTPLNWMHMGWFLQIVLLPTVVVVLGPTAIQLAQVPDSRHLAAAVGLQTLAHVTFLCALHTVRPRRASPVSAGPPVPGVAILLTALVGGLALLTLFGGPGNVLNYFRGNVRSAQGASQLAPFLVPLLGVSSVLALRQAILRQRNRPVWLLICLAGLLVGFGSSGYSRGMFATAIIAMLAMISRSWRRIPLATYVLILLVGSLAALSLGEYRTTFLRTDGGQISVQQAGLNESSFSPRHQVESYMRAPQYLAVIPRALHNETTVPPSALVSNVLAPIPVLGEPFRESTTRTHFSQEVRQRLDVVDMSPPMVGEMYWTLGLLGTVVAFIVLGWLVARLDRRFREASDPGSIFLLMFAGAWCGYLLVGSTQVLVQTIVYMGPALMILHLLRRQLADPPTPRRLPS